MNFTREPITETIITPKEGYKLVVRNSKNPGQEEFFVDAVELVSYAGNCFYRNLEKPKSFLVPVADYEILEVRETRMVLKTAAVEKVKIGKPPVKKEEGDSESLTSEPRKRERRRRKRKLRTEREDGEEQKAFSEDAGMLESKPEELLKPRERFGLIPPPSTLISESISRYKDAQDFTGAFYPAEEKKEVEDAAPFESNTE